MSPQGSVWVQVTPGDGDANDTSVVIGKNARLLGYLVPLLGARPFSERLQETPVEMSRIISDYLLLQQNIQKQGIF